MMEDIYHISYSRLGHKATRDSNVPRDLPRGDAAPTGPTHYCSNPRVHTTSPAPHERQTNHPQRRQITQGSPWPPTTWIRPRNHQRPGRAPGPRQGSNAKDQENPRYPTSSTASETHATGQRALRIHHGTRSRHPITGTITTCGPRTRLIRPRGANHLGQSS
jgi:hypothetical protein